MLNIRVGHNEIATQQGCSWVGGKMVRKIGLAYAKWPRLVAGGTNGRQRMALTTSTIELVSLLHSNAQQMYGPKSSFAKIEI